MRLRCGGIPDDQCVTQNFEDLSTFAKVIGENQVSRFFDSLGNSVQYIKGNLSQRTQRLILTVNTVSTA